jgi:sulfite reductase alpha subunit-like flavoprotein
VLQGENPKKPGAPQNVRLYSIASTRYGDYFDGKTASLCVRRAVYYDPDTGKEDPSKNGVCSNFLCNSKPGDKIKITGKAYLHKRSINLMFLNLSHTSCQGSHHLLAASFII